MPHHPEGANDASDPAALVARVCHEEQVTIWSDEIAVRLSIGGYLRKDWSYEDTLAISGAISDEIRSIVESAFGHPELAALARPAPAAPEKLRRALALYDEAELNVRTAERVYQFSSDAIPDAADLGGIMRKVGAQEALMRSEIELGLARYGLVAAVRALLATPPERVAEKRERSRRLVILESPYAGNIEDNLAYARAALRDCLMRGEAPIASHLLYTQPEVLDDKKPSEREIGIEAGLAWRSAAEAAVFYVDLGWSNGMKAAREVYEREGKPVERRTLVARPVPAADSRAVPDEALRRIAAQIGEAADDRFADWQIDRVVPVLREALCGPPSVAASPAAPTSEDDEAETCFVCDEPLLEGQLVLEDVNEGTMHAACCGPERESYVGADGEPLKDGEPIPQGVPYKSIAAPSAPGRQSGDGWLAIETAPKGEGKFSGPAVSPTPDTHARVLAALDAATRMDAILLMAGEMTAQERRTARAVANGIAAKVRAALETTNEPSRGDHADA